MNACIQSFVRWVGCLKENSGTIMLGDIVIKI